MTWATFHISIPPSFFSFLSFYYRTSYHMYVPGYHERFIFYMYHVQISTNENACFSEISKN